MLEDAETARPSRRVGALMIRKARLESMDVLGLYVSSMCFLRSAFIMFVMMRC